MMLGADEAMRSSFSLFAHEEADQNVLLLQLLYCLDELVQQLILKEALHQRF